MNNEKLILEALQVLICEIRGDVREQVSKDLQKALEELNPTKSEEPYKDSLPGEEK